MLTKSRLALQIAGAVVVLATGSAFAQTTDYFPERQFMPRS
jgi:hypothetical protein